MLYAIIDAVKDWIEGHPLCLSEASPPINVGASSSTKGGSVRTSEGQKACKFFLQGKCRFGSQCRNLHPGMATQTDTQTKTEAQAITEIQTSAKSKQSNDSPKKSSQEDKEDDEDEKKQRMRTATEVISRILWDPDLPSEDFIVGYLDRFIGIQEKPFKEFSWEDISTVGANVLAVPKHRIQYFKYKDVIVWDKRNQIDNFFGSRGGSTIQDVLTKDQKDGSEERDAMKDISLMEAEADSEDHHSTHHYSNINRPTHFVCIHIDNEEVKANIQNIISHITRLNPQLADCLINIPSLHVTLCMARLINDEQIETAKRVLQAARLQFISLLPNCMELSFNGVSNFRERLIFIKMKPEPALSKFVSHLIEQFQAAGLRTPGNHEEYTPHITIVKLSRPMQRELNTFIINPACYQPFLETHLGHQPISSVHLCSMHAPAQPDGFYLRFGTISNSLLGLPESFALLVENQLGILGDMGYFNEYEKDLLIKELHLSIQLQDENKFETVIQELIRVNKEAATFESLTAVLPSVVIMRGLPGSGKSYLAQNCQEMLCNRVQTEVISADDYFTEGAEYRFNPAIAFKAHQYCLKRFLDSLANGKKLVVIDNTNTQHWEYRIYTYICDILGYQCHILEIPCFNPSIAEMFRSRNIHNIQPAAINKMYQRWEENEMRVLVPPQLAYPRDWDPRQPPVFSILSLCQAPPIALPGELKSSNSLVAVYIGIFLSRESQWQLMSACRPTHSQLYGSHVTLVFEPNMKQLSKITVGKKVKFQVIGQADNGRIQAAFVELPRRLVSQNQTAHITISAAEGVPPKAANAILQSHMIRQSHTVVLEGTIGVVVRRATQEEKEGKAVVSEKLADMSFYNVTSSTELKSILPNVLSLSNDSLEEPIATQDKSGIITGDQKVTQLFVFDFDGTLFIPPGNVTGRREYERLTGKKWPHRRGWLNWPESLLPPLKILPGPALPEIRCHANRAGSYTVILTGRAESTHPGLLHVLESAQVFPQKVICKPDITDESTSQFKLRIMKELLADFPDVTLVKFWDDIPENLAAIQWLSQGKGSHIQFDIIDATKLSDIHASIKGSKKTPAPMQTNSHFDSTLQAHLFKYGLLPTLEYQSTVQEGLEFIGVQFAKILDYQGNPSNLLYVFGSSPLHRVSDVDVCLVAPPTHTHIEWITLLATYLQSCGINYVHVGHSSRCPRLKVLIQFSQTPSIEFDIVVALVPNEDLFKNPTDKKLPASKIAELRQAGDAVSKVAISGAVFMEQIDSQIVKGSFSLEEIGAVTEMVVQLLVAKREKGNAYHFIRTFHVVKLLVNYLLSNPQELNDKPTCDRIFQVVVNHAAEMTFENWSDLFSDSVPEEYIPRLSTIFQDARTILKDGDHPSDQCYEDLFMRRDFPPDSYTPVEIRLSGNNELMKWKGKMIVEARLPTYIRQLLAQGLNIVTDGNIKNTTCFRFAVPSVKSAKETLQSVLRPFWNELADLRKENGLTINLTFGQAIGIGPTATGSDVPTDAKTAAIVEQVTSFASSTDKELRLPSTISAHTRLLIHESAERLGLQHSSVGTGRNRYIVLKK